MEIKVHGKHNQVPDSLERYAVDKFSRLTKYLSTIDIIDVEIYEEGKHKDGDHVVEVLVSTPGPLFRTTVRRSDHRECIDLALDRLTRQLTDYKDRHSGKPHHPEKAKAAKVALAQEAVMGADTDETEPSD